MGLGSFSYTMEVGRGHALRLVCLNLVNPQRRSMVTSTKKTSRKAQFRKFEETRQTPNLAPAPSTSTSPAELSNRQRFRQIPLDPALMEFIEVERLGRQKPRKLNVGGRGRMQVEKVYVHFTDGRTDSAFAQVVLTELLCAD
jgi:hypothetical protein